MGIVEKELANFESNDGTEFRIELNRNRNVHIHIDTVRLNMTVEEFEEFTETMSEAKNNIVDIKHIQQ